MAIILPGRLDHARAALTADDREALRFVVRHAGAVGFCFVQRHEDVADLQVALAAERSDDWQRLALVLKIETLRGRQPSRHPQLRPLRSWWAGPDRRR